MKATLIWTINNFLAYGMVYGWSIHGKLACAYYIENNKAFTLTNGGKTSSFFHQRFLPMDYKYRKNRSDFFVGRVERDVALQLLLSEELYEMVSENDDIVFGFQSDKQKFPGFGLTHNQVEQSILQDFSYWKTNLLFHNFDVIHVEKSVFENIFNMVMDLKGKTKNNIKVIMDISLFCHRKNM